MSGINYTPPDGGSSLMFQTSGTFTTAELIAGANSPLFPGIVTQIYFFVTANPTWGANQPSIFFVMDTAISNQVQIVLPGFVADPFSANWLPVDPLGALLWYTQSYASSFLSVQAGGPGLVATEINYTALCWIPA
jgi:hypothetical protein